MNCAIEDVAHLVATHALAGGDIDTARRNAEIASVANSHRCMEPKVTDQPFLRIKLTADGQAPFTVMFEPSGMTFELAGDGFMCADVVEPFSRVLEIVNWPGGVSVWAPGAVITRDADGHEVDRLS